MTEEYKNRIYSYLRFWAKKGAHSCSQMHTYLHWFDGTMQTVIWVTIKAVSSTD